MTSQQVTVTQVEARYRASLDHRLTATAVEVLYLYSGLSSLSATVGAVSIAGGNTNLYKIKQLVATAGSYSLASSGATLRWLTNTIDAATGAYAIASVGATLNWFTYKIEAAPRSFSIDGRGATLIAAVGKIKAATASFAITSVGAVLSKPIPISVADRFWVASDPDTGSNMRWSAINADTYRLLDSTVPAPVVRLDAAIGVGSTLAVAFRPGASFADTMLLLDTPAAQAKYAYTFADTFLISLAVSFGMPIRLAESLGLGATLAVSRAARVIDRLLLTDTMLASAKYGVALTQALLLSDSLRNFFNADAIDGIGFSSSVIPIYRPDGRVAETIGLADALVNKMIFRIVANEMIQFTDAEALSMIFSGVISDTLQITAAYVSPQGTFTTWAVNVVNNAVTEYQNYAFNSFARFGNRYLGANDQGLWLLEGARDNTTNIMAKIRSGFAQFANGRLNGFKGAYVAVRGQGDIILRLITADGRTYHYKVTTNNSMLTTKVELGKGLRARYFAFELETEDFDFDLDSLEFVPMMASRRV